MDAQTKHRKIGYILGISSLLISLLLYTNVFNTSKTTHVPLLTIKRVWRRGEIQDSGADDKPISSAEDLRMFNVDSSHIANEHDEVENDIPPPTISSDFETNVQHLTRAAYISQSPISSGESKLCRRTEMDKIQRDDIPPELYNVAADVFDTVPAKFIDGLRSPCWRLDNKLKCLPAFMLSGVGKCGTTDVWDKIVKHPEIVGVPKEPRWWTRKRLGRVGALYNQSTSTLQYANNFNKIVKIIHEKLQSNDSIVKKLITGDGSPSIYWDNIVWKNTLTENCKNATTPPYVVADVIRAVLPEMKVISVFRNPTSRLYSDYLFDNKSCTREFFHDSVVEATQTFDACILESSRRDCAFRLFSQVYEDDLQTRNSKGRLGRNPLMRLCKGSYSVFVTDWLRAFPRDQLYFLRLEDWHSKCKELLPEIYSWLNLATLPKAETDRICDLKQRNPTRGKKKKGPMLDETKRLIDQFYEPTRKELARLLNDDKWLWN